MHAISAILIFVAPVRPSGGRVDELGQLLHDPVRAGQAEHAHPGGLRARHSEALAGSCAGAWAPSFNLRLGKLRWSDIAVLPNSDDMLARLYTGFLAQPTEPLGNIQPGWASS